MASGMEFMLKSFGLDPEVIKKNVGEFGQIIVQIRDTLARIEARQIVLEARLDQPTKDQPNGNAEIGNGSAG